MYADGIPQRSIRFPLFIFHTHALYGLPFRFQSLACLRGNCVKTTKSTRTLQTGIDRSTRTCTRLAKKTYVWLRSSKSDRFKCCHDPAMRENSKRYKFAKKGSKVVGYEQLNAVMQRTNHRRACGACRIGRVDLTFHSAGLSYAIPQNKHTLSGSDRLRPGPLSFPLYVFSNFITYKGSSVRDRWCHRRSQP